MMKKTAKRMRHHTTSRNDRYIGQLSLWKTPRDSREETNWPATEYNFWLIDPLIKAHVQCFKIHLCSKKSNLCEYI